MRQPLELFSIRTHVPLLGSSAWVVVMSSPSRRLLPRQILFAEYCLTEPSATLAAVRAGYSPRSARNQAHRLLANDDIRRRIARGVAALREQDAARRVILLDGLDRLFEAAMAAGRLEPALGALKAECAMSGILQRESRASPAQRAADADDAPSGGTNGPLDEGTL
jgi:hypothetical protein